jgi:catechol 2,3-dioxygenase-like lactoylglutathione lyase family enzyme
MPGVAGDAPIAFHVSLNVTGLGRSIDFYRVLFGIEPAKRHDDYAKFELDNPPLIFSLVSRIAGTGCSLSHLGFRVRSTDDIRRIQERLTAAGICTQEQIGTLCGYARQAKIWVSDPDANFWEVYVVEEDIEPAVVRRNREGAAARVDPVVGPVVWEHYVTETANQSIPHADDSVDEVKLTGTFNAPLSDAARAVVVGEAFRVLKAGGKVVTHGLVADRSLMGDPPKLPGLAALVSRVPARAEIITALRSAGFIGMQIVKLTETPWFVHEGVGLREVKWVGWKPAGRVPGEKNRQVLYKGPFMQATVDGGWVFPRGQRITVPAEVWQNLQLGAAAEQFLFIEPNTASPCSTA